MRARHRGKLAPEICWEPTRIAIDADLSKQLTVKLDAEKGITGNPLTAEPPATMAGELDKTTGLPTENCKHIGDVQSTNLQAHNIDRLAANMQLWHWRVITNIFQFLAKDEPPVHNKYTLQVSRPAKT